MTTTPQPTRIGFCGLGQWGPNLLRNLRENPACEVVALCDPDEKRLAQFKQLHPEARLYKDADALTADPRIDAVVLATPAGMHEAQVARMLESGKDILVEKPLALTLGAARDLVAAARANGRILMVGHTFLFNPAVRRVREEILAGTLGSLHFIHSQRLSLGRVRDDCNALWNLAPHDISILLYWIGAMPESVTARGLAFHERHRQEDIALCILEFPNRIIASVQVSWLNPVKVRQTTLVGSQRMMLYDDVDPENPLTLFDQGLREVPRPGPEGSYELFHLEVRRGLEEKLKVAKREPLAEEVAHFLHCIRTRKEPLGSGEEALRIISVLEACDKSLKSAGTPVVPEAV